MTIEVLLLAAAGGLCVLLCITLVTLRRVVSASGSTTSLPTDPELYLRPVRERLQEIQEKIDLAQRDAAGSQATVIGELQSVIRGQGELREQGADLGKATQIIATSLTGSGVAGDWGEAQLRRTVELAGMTEHVTFDEEMQFQTDDSFIKPDLIVHLHGGRDIILDAKAPKIDFKESTDAAEKQAEALKLHVGKLSEKHYQKYVPNSLDFVIVFVPTEGILATALSEDRDLWEFSIQKKILLASPMTLFAILKAVEYGWKQSKQSESAKEIVLEAAKLCDHLAEFVSKWNSAAGNLQAAVRQFNEASRWFDNSLKNQVDKVKELGIVTAKASEDTKEITPDVREIKKWSE